CVRRPRFPAFSRHGKASFTSKTHAAVTTGPLWVRTCSLDHWAATVTAILLRKFCSVFVVLVVAVSLAACGGFMSKSNDNRHNQPLSSATQAGLRNMGSSAGEAMVVRIF